MFKTRTPVVLYFPTHQHTLEAEVQVHSLCQSQISGIAEDTHEKKNSVTLLHLINIQTNQQTPRPLCFFEFTTNVDD